MASPLGERLTPVCACVAATLPRAPTRSTDGFDFELRTTWSVPIAGDVNERVADAIELATDDASLP